MNDFPDRQPVRQQNFALTPEMVPIPDCNDGVVLTNILRGDICERVCRTRNSCAKGGLERSTSSTQAMQFNKGKIMLQRPGAVRTCGGAPPRAKVVRGIIIIINHPYIYIYTYGGV